MSRQPNVNLKELCLSWPSYFHMIKLCTHAIITISNDELAGHSYI